jgi:hypothetical protein
MVILRMTIRTRVNTMKAHSTTHKFRSKGINFRKIKSEMKAIIAAKKQRPITKPLKPFCTGSCPVGLTKRNTPNTRKPEVAILSGVSFKTMFF